MGRPLKSTSVGYMSPPERFALCEMARSSLPAWRWLSIHVQRSSGAWDCSELKGRSGTLAQSLKKTLRCMLRKSGLDVHS